MDRRQILVVLITVLAFIGTLVLAAYFSEGGPAERRGSFKFKQGPRKERTTVNESLYNKLVGSETMSGPSDAAATETEQGEQIPDDSPMPVLPEEAAVNEAMNSLTPEQGINRLAALLAALDNLENASRLYVALGTLYAQTGETGIGASEEAFAAAKQFARSDEDRHRAALGRVAALNARGDVDAAANEAAAALAGQTMSTLPGLRLSVARGKLLEQQGAPDRAEAVYKKAMESAEAAVPELGNDAINVYRQACMSVVQLYRKTGREDKAESLLVAMKNKLAYLDVK